MNKKIALALYLTLSAFGASALLNAQQAQPAAMDMSHPTPEQVNEANIKLMRADIRSQRKQVIAANMPLTDVEATKFWPVYDSYIAETVKVDDVRFALLKEYAQSYDTMTDAQADSLIKRYLALDQQMYQLRMKFIPELEKVVTQKKAALFFQIDRRLQMMIELQLGTQIPLLAP